MSTNKPDLTTRKPSTTDDPNPWLSHDDDSFTAWAFEKAYTAFDQLPDGVISMTIVLRTGLEVRLTRPTGHPTGHP